MVLCANKEYIYISNRLINVRRREPPLVKVERKRVMNTRRKLFDIYKALRHFGVSSEEVVGLAHGYRNWLDNPVENVPSYGTVYCLDTHLYSMPFPIERLGSRFVGIEIGGVVYLAGYFSNVGHNEVEAKIQELKAEIAKNFAAADYFSFKLRMPTRAEAKVLVEKTNDNRDLSTKIYNKYGNVWITPSADHPERTFATLIDHSAKPHCPSENTQAALYLVVQPKGDDLFIGEVDYFGKLTPKTSLNRNLLFSSVKH